MDSQFEGAAHPGGEGMAERVVPSCRGRSVELPPHDSVDPEADQRKQCGVINLKDPLPSGLLPPGKPVF